jgi:gas vesicle protein
MKDLSKVLLAFFVGALAGTAAGLLLAPDKGENTRKKIKDSIDDVSEKAKKTFQKVKDVKETAEA